MAKVKDQVYDGSEESYTDADGRIHYLGDLIRQTTTYAYPLHSGDIYKVIRKSPRGYKPALQGLGSDKQLPWRMCFQQCCERWNALPDDCPAIGLCPPRSSKKNVWDAKTAQGVMCSYFDLYLGCCISSCTEISVTGPDGVTFAGGAISADDECWPCPTPCRDSVLSIAYTTAVMGFGESQALHAHDSAFGDAVPCCQAAELEWRIVSGGGTLGNADTTAQELLAAINEGGTELEKIQITEDWIIAHKSASPTTVINPITEVEHNAYSLDIDGVLFYFDSVDPPIIGALMEYVSHGKFPPPLKKIIEAVQIVAEDSPGGPDVIALNFEGTLTIFGDREVDVGILGHEASHQLAMTTWGQAAPPTGSPYMAAINSPEPPVSEYGATSPGEDFAEAMRLYTTDPDELLSIAPLRFAAVKNILRDAPGLGLDVVYFAPDSNPTCEDSPVIELTDCCGRSASLSIAVTHQDAQHKAYYIDLGICNSDCATDGTNNYAWTWYDRYFYDCLGVHLEEYDTQPWGETTPTGPGNCADIGNALAWIAGWCAANPHPYHVEDLRTPQWIADGCCPEIL